MFDADGERNVPHREWVLDFQQAISEVRTALKEEGREEEFIGPRWEDML
jgi:adenosine deaminase CECR1